MTDERTPIPVILTLNFSGNQSVINDPGIKLPTIWDWKNQRLLHRLEAKPGRAHSNIISSVRFHPTQSVVATACHDNHLMFWSTDTGRPLADINVDEQNTLGYGTLGILKDIAFSPDGKRFYVDDSERRNIRGYDVGPDGNLSNGRIFGEEPGGPHEGVPDGIKVDHSGNVFVTGPKGIWIWDPQGRHLGTIVMPEQPANLAWGDKDYRTLYITATTSVYRLQTKARGFVPYLKK